MTPGIKQDIDCSARFWEKVLKTDNCWTWTGSRSAKGFGRFLLNGRNTGAHRVALMLSGIILPDKYEVGHRCRNKACVRPEHLFLALRDDRVSKFRMPIESRFWSKVVPEPNTGCWLWLFGTNKGGYGGILINNRPKLAHRVAWELSGRAIPAGMCVLHKCDTPACVNPDHLFLGTRTENNHDKGRKKRGRGPNGERCHLSKLTADQVSEAKLLYAAGGISYPKLAKKYGVSYPTIRCAIIGKTWRHLSC